MTCSQKDNPPSICVFGGGAVGQYLAGMLSMVPEKNIQTPRLSLVCRGSTLSEIKQAGNEAMCVSTASRAPAWARCSLCVQREPAVFCVCRRHHSAGRAKRSGVCSEEFSTNGLCKPRCGPIILREAFYVTCFVRHIRAQL